MATTKTIARPVRPAPFLYFRDHGKLLLVLVLGFATLTLASVLGDRFAMTESGPEALAGIVMEPPKTLPDLTLQHTDGSAWTSSDMHGRLSLFFFGYTNCPDVCPLTLSRARQIYDALGTDAEAVDVYFTTVDPERDTPERLGRYVEQFNPAFLSLTGSTEQLEAAKNAFGVVAVRQETGSSSGYSVDHTATSYLIDGTGSIRAIFPHDAATEDVLHDIRVLLDETDS